MARIRSIKPEFWRDAKIAGLRNKLAGYFFIALWNVADDEGKFRLDPKALELECPIFRSKEIVTYLCELSAAGLVQKCEDSAWGVVTNWHHQKISHPKVPKVKRSEIRWVDEPISRNDLEASGNFSSRSRIKDQGSRIVDQGSDTREIRKSRKPRTKPAAEEPKLDGLTARPPEPADATKPAGMRLIALYCDMWRQRHQVNESPPITGKDAGIVRRLLGSTSFDRLAFLLEAYFAMPEAYFVKARHPLELFESRIKEIAVFAESGKFTTRSEVVAFDQMASHAKLLNKIERGEL